MKADPLVPIGALTTAGILVGGLRAFNRGDKAASQKWMRARVIAQGLTVVCLGYTSYTVAMNKRAAAAALAANPPVPVDDAARYAAMAAELAASEGSGSSKE